MNVTAVEVGEQLDSMQYILSHNYKLWNLINDWTSIKELWINTPIRSLKFDEIDHYILEIQEATFSVESGKYVIMLSVTFYGMFTMYVHYSFI